MTLLSNVLVVLDRELSLQGKALHFTEDTKLAGALPQLDSMAIVNVVAALEEKLDFEFPEDQLDGAIFETVGTLVDFLMALIASDKT